MQVNKQAKGFRLEEGDKKEFNLIFRPGALWSFLREDHEALRFWNILRESGSEILMHHGTGAVARIELEDGRLKDVVLLQNGDAEEVMRREGFRVSGQNRKKTEKHIRTGRPVQEALREAWPRKGQIKPLTTVELPEGGRLLRYSFAWGAVLEIEADRSGRIRKRRLLEGGDALDAHRNKTGVK